VNQNDASTNRFLYGLDDLDDTVSSRGNPGSEHVTRSSGEYGSSLTS
jgi:hypothetical protein